MDTPSADFDEFRKTLIGLEVSHVWRGYGSALFVEFGELKERTRRDGTPGNPRGEMGLMVEWSWRIEDGSTIVCGSWSDEEIWPAAFDNLKGAKVADASLFGRLPEISIGLTNGFFIVSFMTAQGNPEWALFDRTDPDSFRSISARDGHIHLEAYPPELGAPAST